MIESDEKLSIQDQCGLLSLSRSGYYYIPSQETELKLRLLFFPFTSDNHIERSTMRRTEDMNKTLDDLAVRIGTLGYIEKSKDAELVAALRAIVRKAGK